MHFGYQIDCFINGVKCTHTIWNSHSTLRHLLKRSGSIKSVQNYTCMLQKFYFKSTKPRNINCWEPAYCILGAYCILSAALSTASSFRIWNSSTRILSLLGPSVRHSAHGKGHEEGGSAHTKAGSSLRSPPGNPRVSTPQYQSLPTFCFVLSPTPLTLRGAVPHYLSLKKELTYSSS